METGELIVVAFGGVVALFAGVGTILNFIKTHVIAPRMERMQKDAEIQLQQSKIQSETNERLANLTEKIDHQNELTEIRLTKLHKEIDAVDTRYEKGYKFLDGRLVKVEEIVFEKTNIKRDLD